MEDLEAGTTERDEPTEVERRLRAPDERSAAGRDGIGFEILRSIRRILRRVSKHSKELARETGLTVPQLVCLKAIVERGEGGISVGAISGRVSLSAATVSRIVDRLGRKGLVERQRGEHDRRKVYLTLSDAGKERAAALPAPLDERFLERLARMPDGERFALLHSLERIVALMDAEDEDAAPMLVEGLDVDAESG